ncbi:efflux RND transporter periplasmic adaptor subunit [Leptothoe sp. LEGE 181152]|nr:efflux RND transporter periplasmic adaptor subunit [Adonisia turfae]MDV3351607.1 efflux RND transporter periplasmic adaptor subunit [Leptothoe sp. LEGE 181152]
MTFKSPGLNSALSTVFGISRQRLALICLGTIGFLMIGIPRIKERIASSAEVPSEQAERVLPVETLTVTPVSSYLVSRTYTGEIASLRASELGFERSGQLVEVLVVEGEVVDTGAPLARLDIRNLKTQRQQLLAEKARANAQLMELQTGARSEDIAAAAAAVRDLEEQLRLQQVQRTRRDSLYTQGAISREELDEFSFGEGALQARLDQSRSQLEELQNGTRPEQIMAQQALVQQLDASIADLDVTISKSTLQAPFAGVISAKQVDEGTVVGAGQSVIRLLENAIPEARIGMPVSAIDQLNIGDEKTVYLGERPYSATVSSILPEVDAQTRTQTVVLALESAAASQANTGQTVRVNLQASIPTDGMWLPTEALTQGIRGLWTCYVLVPDENSDGGYYTVQSQSVEVVYQDSDRILVRGTLQPNDMVVASGPHRLVPGQLVTPVQP